MYGGGVSTDEWLNVDRNYLIDLNKGNYSICDYNGYSYNFQTTEDFLYSIYTAKWNCYNGIIEGGISKGFFVRDVYSGGIGSGFTIWLAERLKG